MEWNTISLFIGVALGGAAGAVLRYTVYRSVETEFPWATFIVNIVGCTLAAFLMFKFGSGMDKMFYTALFTGVFGAFTTMSTFSIDTIKLFVNEEYLSAIFNFVINAVLCVCGAAIGRWLALIGN